MRGTAFLLLGLAALAVLSVLVGVTTAEGTPPTVHSTYKEAKEVVHRTGRPLVVAFVRANDTSFMGAQNSLFSDKAFEKVVGYFVFLKVEFNVGGGGTQPQVANPENAEIANKVLAKEGGTIPAIAILTRDEALLKFVKQANPKALLATLPQEMAQIVNQLKPLSPAEEEKLGELWKDAEKALENNDTKEALEILKKIAKSGKRCGYVEDAKKKIEELSKTNEPAQPENPSESQKPAGLEKGKECIAIIETDFGKIVVRLSPKDSPNAYHRFIKLARDGFYKNSGFHRVMKSCAIFGGFRDGDTTKEPDEGIDAEFNDVAHEEGTFGMEPMASNKKKINCEFCICLKKMSEIERTDVVIGKVIEGLFVAKSIGEVKVLNKAPVNKITIREIRIEEPEAKK